MTSNNTHAHTLQNKRHNQKDEKMTNAIQNPQGNQDIKYAVLEEIRNDILREEEFVNQRVQLLEYDCDMTCDRAHKKVIETYSMGGNDEYETVTTYDSEGNPDDYYKVYVEYKEAHFVDVQCTVCGTVYTQDYPEKSDESRRAI